MASAAETKRERRPHRKSRLGCLACKQRKIKCDESRPICLNCVRREIDCEFPKKDSRKYTRGYISRRESLPTNTNQAILQSQHAGAHLASVHTESTFHTTFRFKPYTKCYGSESEVRTALDESKSDFNPSDGSRALSEQNFRELSERVSFLESSLNHQKPRNHEPNGALTHADMALMHHYFNMPDKTPGDEEMLQASLRHPHLLHLILGFSALHWSRQELNRKEDLVARADRHYVVGMRGATELLGGARQDTHEDMALVHKSAILIGIYNLALGPQPGEYVGFSDHNGGASFLIYLRGIKIIGENKEGKTKSPEPTTPDMPQSETKSYNMGLLDQASLSAITGYATYLEHLRCLARACPRDLLNSTSKDTSIYLTAINQLEPFFQEIYYFQPETYPSAAKATDPHSRVPFAWLYRVSSRFINRLQEKETLALAIFACFALILKKLETGWVVEGWPEHIMFGVWKFLGPEWRGLVEWPMEEMGLDRLGGVWAVSQGFV
ncbi:hypothetical protein IFR05_010081 [Cadophora sp. M221]|nr:hypothetical protein IFR05_010081 [Cadophora sp. M221]